jgi:hypothetical protein
MTSVTWQRKLDAAHTEDDVVEVVGAFLTRFSAIELARLPAHCRPPPIGEAEDVADYAYVLVRERCASEGGATRLVAELTAFFSAATVRLGEIAMGRDE